MCCGNQRFNLEPCTILLVIAILNNLGLLDTNCNPVAKNALTLLLLWWLCGANRGNLPYGPGQGVSPYNNDGCCC